jgi:hypothetical protein
MGLDGKTVLVLGGSSGIGFGVAGAAQIAGASVTIASRSSANVDAALKRLGGTAKGATLDTADFATLDSFFAERAPFDHVFCSAARPRVAAVRELPLIPTRCPPVRRLCGERANVQSQRCPSGVVSAEPAKPGKSANAARESSGGVAGGFTSVASASSAGTRADPAAWDPFQSKGTEPTHEHSTA